MPLMVLSLETFASMDGGRAAEAFAQALKRLQADLEDRPALKKARSLRLSVSFTPIPSERGMLEGMNVTWDLSESIPKRSSAPYRMRSGAKGPVFSSEAPENPDQLTVSDAIASKEKNKP